MFVGLLHCGLDPKIKWCIVSSGACLLEYWLLESERELNPVCISESMPRRPAYLKKSVKSEFERLHRKCCYCKTHQNTRGFDKHVAWCKKIWMIRNELRDLQSLSVTTEVQAEGTSSQIPSSLQVNCPVESAFIEGSSSIPMEVDHPPDLDLQETTTTNGTLSLSQTSPPDFYLEFSRTQFHIWTSFTTWIH